MKNEDEQWERIFFSSNISILKTSPNPFLQSWKTCFYVHASHIYKNLRYLSLILHCLWGSVLEIFSKLIFLSGQSFMNISCFTHLTKLNMKYFQVFSLTQLCFAYLKSTNKEQESSFSYVVHLMGQRPSHETDFPLKKSKTFSNLFFFLLLHV